MLTTPEEQTRRTRTWHGLLAIGPAVVVLIFGGVAYDGVVRTDATRAMVGETRDAIAQAVQTLSTLQDAETGQRGYLITGDPRYLDPYERALQSLRTDTAGLRALTRSNPAQQRRLDSLAAFVHAKLDELAETIDLRRTRGLAAVVPLVEGDRGRHAMVGARAVLGEIIGEEQALLDSRLRDEAARRRLVTLTLVAGTIAGVALSLFVTVLLFQRAEAEARSARLIAKQHDELQTQATELEMQAQQLQEQAAELEMQNESLTEARDEAERGRTAAEAANRTKTEFLSVMSHELRTPLNAIAGHAQLVEMGVHGPVTDAQREALERLQRSQAHLLYLINDLLNLARIESGRVEYQIDRVTVTEVLKDVSPMIEPQFAAKEIRFETTVPADRVVLADRDKLQQILINLLGNAAKFTPAGGRVSVSVGSRPGSAPNTIFVRVRDTGPGIPRSKQESIFEPFVQLDRQSNHSSQQGVGLGLAIARDLARGMGGDLRVRSTLGEGAVFTLTLREAGE